MSTETKRTVATFAVETLDDLEKLIEVAGDHEDPLSVYVEGPNGDPIEAKLVETVLTDGSKTYDVVLKVRA